VLSVLLVSITVAYCVLALMQVGWFKTEF